MTIDDDFAAIFKLDFQHTAGSKFKINIGLARLKRVLDLRQCCICQAVEFLVIHRVLPSRSLLTASSPMTRIAAVLLTIGLAACGMKGPLELPPGPAPEPLFGNSKAAKPAATTGAGNVSTDPKTNPK